MNLRTKLYLGFGLAVVVLIGWGVYTAWQFQEPIALAREAKIEAALQKGEIQHQEQALLLGKAVLNESLASAGDIGKTSSGFDTWLRGPERQTLPTRYPELVQTVDQVERLHGQLGERLDQILETARSGDWEAARELYQDRYLPLVGELTGALDDELETLEQQGHGFTATLDTLEGHQTTTLVFSLLLAVALALFAFLMVRNILGITGRFSNTLASTSAELATTVEEDEKVLAQQMSAVSETTSTMDELDASGRRTAEQAKDAAEGARKAADVTESGSERIQAMLGQMEGLKDKIEGVGRQIQKLTEQTAQIETITDTVTDIAGQTNLLALNASVEAARAGEHGRGFNVVAQEIRKLAVQSKQSAENIGQLVNQVKKVTDTTVMSMEAGTRSVDETVETGREAGTAFEQARTSVLDITENTEQIAMTARQQSDAISQVLEAMHSLRDGADESTQGIGEIRAGIRQLQDMIQELKTRI
ncbi:MAG: methyl-accepting chemotaxis protein [Guyparkeria sp.]